MDNKVNKKFSCSLRITQKKGELTIKEIIETILGGAASILLVIFLYQWISPNYAIAGETSESYFDNFKEQVAIADSGDIGSFSIWLPENKKEKRSFYLVYFGSSSSYGSEMKFYSLGNNLNHICLCSLENKETKCNYCKNLDYPVRGVELDVDDSGRWAIGVWEKIEIIKTGEFYEIKKI